MAGEGERPSDMGKEHHDPELTSDETFDTSDTSDTPDTADTAETADVRANVEKTRQARAKMPLWAIPVPPEDLAPGKLTERLGDGLLHVAEILLAGLGLLVFSPIMLIEAIFVKVDSKGPALFWHERAAKSQRLRGSELIGREDVRCSEGEFELDREYYVPVRFLFPKFRGMYADSEERFPEYYWWNYDLTPEELQKMFYKLDDDPRVTRAGKLLRKTSLDELPNLWSVLTGKMRLVGPRPEALDFVAYYTPEQMNKFRIKPGITCLSKIHGRGELSVQEQVDWDLEYVRTRSVALDMKILFLTFWLVISRRGAL